jgi:hypothetical protein
MSIKKIYKNYRLPLKRLYGRRIFKKEEYRKEFAEVLTGTCPVPPIAG